VDYFPDQVVVTRVADVSMTLSASVVAPVFGQEEVFHATLTPEPGAPTPTGKVVFTIMAGGTTTSIAEAIHATGTATFPPMLDVGTYTIGASYDGRPIFSPVTAVPLSVTVGQDSSSTTIQSSLNPSTAGQDVTFTVAVTTVPPGGGIPTGTVQFSVDGQAFGLPMPLSATTQSATTQTASVTIHNLAAASHTITASYS